MWDVNVRSNEQKKNTKEFSVFDKNNKQSLTWFIEKADAAWEDLAKKVQQMIDKRLNWPSYLYREIYKFLKHEDPKDDFTLEMIKSQDEIVLALADKFIEWFSINTVPKQKNLTEDLKDMRKEEKPRKEIKLVKKK